MMTTIALRKDKFIFIIITNLLRYNKIDRKAVKAQAEFLPARDSERENCRKVEVLVTFLDFCHKKIE